VRTRLAEITRVRLRLRYELLREEELLATGETAHVFADRDKRPIRVAPAVVEFLRDRTGPPPEALR
jgi:acyl-CoA thioesterase FadM